MKRYMTIEEYFKTQSMSKVEKDRKKVFRYVFVIMCLSIILFSILTIFKWCTDNSKIRQINKKIEENTSIDNSRGLGEFVNPPIDKKSDYYYYASIPFYQVSFSVLSSMNKDTVAFIRVRGTNIKYPVVKTDNNNYYLNHSFDKSNNNAGWIFMDYRSNINKLDDNTVIYGHARLDGTMFGTLKKTLSADWQSDRDNYVIFISTPKENMIFQIFSIYTIKREGYYITPHFSSKSEKQEWIDTMKKRNVAPIDTEVNIKDKFFTLSTCRNHHDERVVVHAKLIKVQKRSYS